ncbi:MAG: YicC family protein [Thermoguttaceae bacterium]|nr:YicC family protein [Thermoguttaceae bacterium]
MLMSMTGFGAASTQENGFVISSEIKAVNNRFLKASIRLPDGFASLELKIEELIRSKLARGSVNFSLRLERAAAGNDFALNFDVLRRYLAEATRFEAENPELTAQVPLGDLVDYIRLPGVVQDAAQAEKENLPERLWDAIARNVEESLAKMQEMRAAEGAATAKYLAENLAQLREGIGEIARLAPQVVENYRKKLTERVGKAMADAGATLDPSDLIREIAVYTDRVDISEEISRFYSHVKQFEDAMNNEPICGKKLDFLTQEMFRETNTIGSKANSPDVLQYVVEMKSTIERVREMVQNVE